MGATGGRGPNGDRKGEETGRLTPTGGKGRPYDLPCRPDRGWKLTGTRGRRSSTLPSRWTKLSRASFASLQLKKNPSTQAPPKSSL